MASPEARKQRSPDKVLQRYTKVPHHAHHPHHPHHPHQNPLKKKQKNRTRKYVLAGGEKIQKTRKYYSPIQSPDKVLQRYTKPPQDIVV